VLLVGSAEIRVKLAMSRSWGLFVRWRDLRGQMVWRPLSTIQSRVRVRDDLVRMLGTRMNTLHTKTTSCQRRSAMGNLITDHNKADVLTFIAVNR
jgi:hypothetical protein